MPSPAKDLSKGNQRSEASLLPVSADTRHDLQLSPRFVCIYPPPASRSNEDALFRMMSFAVAAVWCGISSLMNKSSAKPSIPAKGSDNIMDGGV